MNPAIEQEGVGLGLPADPSTGLPVQPYTRYQFWLSLAAVPGALLLGLVLLLGALVAFPGPAAPGSGGDEQGPALAAGPDASGSSKSGAALYEATCKACHGPGGKGIPGLGKPLVGSDFVDGLDDEALVRFIEAGRPADDPANTTKVPMPPKGGNPNLSADDLRAIVRYLRSLRP